MVQRTTFDMDKYLPPVFTISKSNLHETLYKGCLLYISRYCSSLSNTCWCLSMTSLKWLIPANAQTNENIVIILHTLLLKV